MSKNVMDKNFGVEKLSGSKMLSNKALYQKKLDQIVKKVTTQKQCFKKYSVQKENQVKILLIQKNLVSKNNK